MASPNFIYLQTGDQDDYNKINDAKYAIFSRADFLMILADADGEKACRGNHILSDYASYLRHIEDEVKSYYKIPIGKWNRNSRIGFSLELTKLDEMTGENPKRYKVGTGACYAFSWCDHDFRDGTGIFLILYQKKLAFRIRANAETLLKACISND